MREIKFRALSNHINKWEYGNFIQDEKGNKYVIPFNYLELDGHHLICVSDIPVFIKDGTEGQYTGLKDKNGVEIYEGDICKVNSCENFEVIWRGIGFCFKGNDEKCFVFTPFDYWIEVIGNIYENPELLEEKNVPKKYLMTLKCL